MDSTGRPARAQPPALVGAVDRYLRAVLAQAKVEGHGSNEKLRRTLEPAAGFLIAATTIRDWMSQKADAPPWFFVVLARRFPSVSFDAYALGQGPAERLDALEAAVYELQERWEERESTDGAPLAHRLQRRGA